MQASNRRYKLLIVRAATPADAEAVLRIVADVAAERRWLAMEPPLDLDARRVDWIANLGPSGGGAFVALDGEQIVGELSLWPAEAGALALGTVIADGWRRRGVGSQLLAAAISATQGRKGIRRIDLAVFPHNEAALALYRKYGFVETALEPEAVPRESGEFWDVILMRREFA